MEVLCSVYRFPAPYARSVMGLFSSSGHFCGIRPSLLPRKRLECVSHLPQGLLAPSFLPEAVLLLALWLQLLRRPHAKQLASASSGKKGCPEPKRERQTLAQPLVVGWRKESGSWLCSMTLAKAFPRLFCSPLPLFPWQPVRLCISAPQCQALLPPSLVPLASGRGAWLLPCPAPTLRALLSHSWSAEADLASPARLLPPAL